MTINSTTPAIITTSAGSNSPNASPTWVSNSRYWLTAACSSMVSSSPLCSPLAIM